MVFYAQSIEMKSICGLCGWAQDLYTSLRGVGIALLGTVADTVACSEVLLSLVWCSEEGAWKP
jgi:hypothetical protein